jgi:Uma2 family endonuclease
MTAVKKPAHLSIGDYLAGEELSPVKHEYLGGTVHAMAGATNLHNEIATAALLVLGLQLRGKPCRPFNSDTKVRLEFADHTRFYYPDAMVVCDSNQPNDHFQDRPVAIVEVLSESTRRVDMGEKRDAYLTIPSLKVLLLAESDRPSVVVHRRQSQGGFVVELHEGLDAVIPLPEIEAQMALAELYERVEFAA